MVVTNPALRSLTVAELQTQPTEDDVEAFLAAIPGERRQADARVPDG